MQLRLSNGVKFMIIQAEHQDHYVYVLEYEGKCLYVGSGRKSRINHVLSGASHNKYLNEFYFYCDKEKLNLSKIAENLSKTDSLKIEMNEIMLRSPYLNINDTWDRLDPDAIARAVVLDMKEKFVCRHYADTYLCD